MSRAVSSTDYSEVASTADRMEEDFQQTHITMMGKTRRAKQANAPRKPIDKSVAKDKPSAQVPKKNANAPTKPPTKDDPPPFVPKMPPLPKVTSKEKLTTPDKLAKKIEERKKVLKRYESITEDQAKHFRREVSSNKFLRSPRSILKIIQVIGAFLMMMSIDLVCRTYFSPILLGLVVLIVSLLFVLTCFYYEHRNGKIARIVDIAFTSFLLLACLISGGFMLAHPTLVAECLKKRYILAAVYFGLGALFFVSVILAATFGPGNFVERRRRDSINLA